MWAPEWTALSVTVNNLILLLAYYCLHVGLCHRSQRSVLMKPVVALSALALYLIATAYFYFSEPVRSDHQRLLMCLFIGGLLCFSIRVVPDKQSESHLGNRLTVWSLYVTLALIVGFAIAGLWLGVFGVPLQFFAFITIMSASILLLGGLYGSFLHDAVARHYRTSITDNLTGLHNRRYLIDESRKLLSPAARHHFPLSVVMCDIDKFKNINDTYGHDVGDEVIKTFAQVLQRCARTEDIIARWGGEEFVVLLARTEVEQAIVLAERMREETGRIYLDARSGSLTFTASFGVAVVDAELDVEVGIKHADDALYRAKAGGRNCVEVSAS